jgi:parallel beta-helix repeat protein
MKRLLTICVVATMILAVSGVAQADATNPTVDVSLEPSMGIVVSPGQTFELELWLRSDTPGVDMTDIELLLYWDPTCVSFSGSASTADADYDWALAQDTPPYPSYPMYPWEGSAGENATYDDGDAWISLYPIWSSFLGMPKPQTDLHAVTLTFTALALTDSTVITVTDGVFGLFGVTDNTGYDLTRDLTGATVSIAPPTEVWVDDNFDSSTPGWQITHFDNIQDGIDAVAGSIVNVADGTYTITAAINVNKGVTITGDISNPANVVVTYSGPSQTLDCFDMQANDITVQGIKVMNGRYGFNFATVDPTGCTISNCVIDYCYEGAINIDGGSGHTISDNTITNCLTSGTKRGAIHIYGCPDVTIDRNTLTDNGLTGYHATMGIYVKFTYPSSSSERVKIINNDISGMLGINADIQIYDAPYTYIYNNTISSSEDKGIAIWGIDGNPAYTSTDNRVEVIGNTISSTYYPGLQACNAPYTYFYNNTLTSCNYYGGDGTGDFDYASIHIDSGSAHCLINSNTVSDGINGIQLWSDNCTVTNNEIYDMGLTYANTKTTTDGTYHNSAILYGDMYNVWMPTSATISCNNIYDNYWGLFVISAYEDTVTAENNWWGSGTGPTHAGNTGGSGDAVSDNVDYDPWTPGYACSGFEPPMDKGAVKVKKNRVLPLKIELLDGDYPLTDVDIIAPPVIQVIFQPTVGDAEDVTDEALSAGQGMDGNQFFFTGSNWQFNLKTKNYSASGTYTITMVSGDECQYVIESACTAQFVID